MKDRELFVLGLGFLAFPTLIFILASLQLILGLGHLEIAPVLALLGALVILYRARAAVAPATSVLVSPVILVGAIIVFALISRAIYDVSFSGQWYHQEAVLRLASGWNPFRGEHQCQSLEELAKTFGLKDGQILHFPLGSWLVSASLFRLTGDLEMAKLYHWMLMGAAFFLSLATLWRFTRLGRWVAMMIALVVAVNPVAFPLALGFFVDGDVASLIACALALGFWLRDTKARAFATTAGALALAMLVNVKFTGLVYSAVLLTLLLTIKSLRSEFRRAGLPLAFSFGLAVCVFGFHPYLRNVLYHGNPFYPVAGEAANVFDSHSTRPKAFNGMSAPIRIFYSIFSKPVVEAEYAGAVELRSPLSFDRELFGSYWRSPVLRIGGLGPFFPVAAILALVLMAALLNKPRDNLIPLVLVATLLASLFIVSESYWARYGPQLWFIPLVLIIASIHKSRWQTWAACACLAALVGNVFVAAYSAKAVVVKSVALDRQLNGLSRETVHRVAFGQFTSNRFRLSHLGIKFEEADACPTGVRLVESVATLCTR